MRNADLRREIVAKHLHAARCNACGGAPSYSGEHRRPLSDYDFQQADNLLGEMDALPEVRTPAPETEDVR